MVLDRGVYCRFGANPGFNCINIIRAPDTHVCASEQTLAQRESTVAAEAYQLGQNRERTRQTL